MAAADWVDLAAVADAECIVLVEGHSDRRAVEVLAERTGVDLAARAIVVVAMGGATNVRAHLEAFGPQGLGRRLAGLVDAGETLVFQRALEYAGCATVVEEADLAGLGFFVCVRDLEDELIRAVGTAGVERVLAEHRDLGAWRTFQRQPAQRERADDARLRRFMGTKAGRKLEYAQSLAEVLDLDRLPLPLLGLLHYVAADPASRTATGGL